MSDNNNKKDGLKQVKKKNLIMKPTEKTDSPYVQLAIALEELSFDDFKFEEDES